MPKQKEIQITGTIGSNIYYKWKDIYCIRAKGNTGKQAPVAKIQASILGKASTISARLRAAFVPLLPDPRSRKMMYRFNNAIQQLLRTDLPGETVPINGITSLNGFSFYENSSSGNGFYVAMPVNRTADGKLVLQIPSFDSPNPISPLPFSGQIRLHVIAVSCNLNNPADTKSYEAELDIFYTGSVIPAQEMLLPLQTLPGHLTLVALSVNNSSAGIVGAMYN